MTWPDHPLLTGRTLAWHGRGVGRVATLPGLLAPAQLVPPGRVAEADAVLAWGRKPSAERAEAWARRHGLPLLRLEDGFLRSLGLGADEPPLSLVLDDEGIYYDARSPSRLERLAAAPLTEAERARAQALRAAWCEARVSKYNHARERPELVREGDVLVADQTWGDASIACAQAGPADFARMLEAALDEHPQARIVLKVHPDVVAGRKRGHFEPGRLSRGAASRVVWLGESAHPPGLLARVAAVYVVSSQLGFEALLWGRPVRCFGLPFYAGWGLTDDAQAAPARRRPVALEALVHGALVAYPRYLHPETRQTCAPEDLVDWMGLQRRQRERFAPQLSARGFSWWKRPIVRRYLAGSSVRFESPQAPAAPGDTLVLWGRQPLPPGAPEDTPVLRLEDGFLRSVGLGADLRQPLSWVQDEQGLYYDATRPSALEALLASHPFEPALLQRAAALRERILALGLTKYNLAAAPTWQRPANGRPVVLVVGQVESDASIRWGATGLRENLAMLQAVRARHPQAWLVYKPHPDVVARLRAAGQGEDEAATVCDEVLVDASMDTLLREVDEVHVLTSLAGFEALLRGKPVTTWGAPFYAGWGLTHDEAPPPRRGRALSLDMLVAGALILYPSYVSRVTGHFTTPERVVDELQAWRDEPPSPAWRQHALRWALQLGERWRRWRV